ncbi:Probably ATP-dependent helicase [Shigella sonnei]|nr:Probably ATP-dependent helicase [Shigella sonnei]SJJ73721.1 Probably ATP-dependent helicase [Shigella sonnei]
MLERALNRIMLVVIASRFPETEKPLPLKTEKCHNIGCLYSISGFLGNDSNLLIVFYVQIMPDDFVMQLHRF